MQLYLQASGAPLEQWVIIAATNLEGNAALWIQQANADLMSTTWDSFVAALRDTFLPRDVLNR